MGTGAWSLELGAWSQVYGTFLYKFDVDFVFNSCLVLTFHCYQTAFHVNDMKWLWIEGSGFSGSGFILLYKNLVTFIDHVYF